MLKTQQLTNTLINCCFDLKKNYHYSSAILPFSLTAGDLCSGIV